MTLGTYYFNGDWLTMAWRIFEFPHSTRTIVMLPESNLEKVYYYDSEDGQIHERGVSLDFEEWFYINVSEYKIRL